MLSDEVLGWLALVPLGVLRLVAMRLPAALRKTVYEGEWLPELQFILRKAEGRPITRLTTGIWYACSLIRSAGRIARTLANVREEPESSYIGVAGIGMGRTAAPPDHPGPNAILNIVLLPMPRKSMVTRWASRRGL
jgi:hypothetical protein